MTARAATDFFWMNLGMALHAFPHKSVKFLGRSLINVYLYARYSLIKNVSADGIFPHKNVITVGAFPHISVDTTRIVFAQILL